MVEGSLISGIIKYMDLLVGTFARVIYSHTVKIDDNKVFFMPQESAYTCNPKYICEELRKQCPDVEVVYRVNSRGKNSVPEGITTVQLNKMDYFRELFSSKIIVANSFIYLGMPYRLKKGQVLIQTWHGSLGLKKHNKEVLDSIKRAEALEYTGRRTDYLVTNSTLEISSLRETYWPKTPMLKYGHPRNDIFFPNYEKKRSELRRQFAKQWEVSPETKFVMYAPTFRDTKSFDCYDLDFERVVEACEKKFGGEWKLLLRYHPSLYKQYSQLTTKLPDCVIDCTEFTDMQELIAVTDVAITDYSSWIYDYILMRKPGFLFATDIKEYCENERGFYYPIEETPFLIATSNDEMIKCIENYNDEVYHKKLEAFLVDKGCIDDGHASQRTVRLIRNILAGRKHPERIKGTEVVRS
jgi:CDP-glycerol glycerophosphotransferase